MSLVPQSRQQPDARALQNGFTLIELLVVVVIIGVVVSFMSLSVNPNSNADRLDTEARRLEALIVAAADDAILYGREVGFDITRNGYRFLRLGDDGWQVLNVPDSPLRARKLGAGLGLALIERDESQPQLTPAGDDNENDDEDEDGEDALRPEAVFLSSGEIVPFALAVYADGVDHRFIVRGEANGDVERERLGGPR